MEGRIIYRGQFELNYESRINGFNGIKFNTYSIDCGYSSPELSTIDMFEFAM